MIGTSNFVPATGSFRRVTIFVLKSYIDSFKAFSRLHNVGLRLITLTTAAWISQKLSYILAHTCGPDHALIRARFCLCPACGHMGMKTTCSAPLILDDFSFDLIFHHSSIFATTICPSFEWILRADQLSPAFCGNFHATSMSFKPQNSDGYSRSQVLCCMLTFPSFRTHKSLKHQLTVSG